MKSLIFCLVFFSLNISNIDAFMMHQKPPIAQEWKEENLPPFDELMLSWNAIRPIEGRFLFYVSVKTDEWSPWLLYAAWGSDEQSSFLNTAEESPVKVYQDALEVLNGEKATAFQIKIIAEGSVMLDRIHALHVYTNGSEEQELQPLDSCLDPIYLQVPGLSQMTVEHPRHKDLCSPTSTTAVIRYLSEDYTIDPISFAQNVWDSGFNIFGNWVFNVANASAYLGSQWECWVERLNGFEHIYQYLSQGTPVVVSVRGPLPGSAQPYATGHLIAVIGYDPLNEKVICMDPAFPTDIETHVFYDRSDFVEAWSRRGNIAYVFNR
jgi:hypothetical protein